MYQPQNFKSFQYFWIALLCVLRFVSDANGNGHDWSMMCDVGSEKPSEFSPLGYENITISMTLSTKTDSSIKAVVELAIFCDMNFSSTFNYDMNAIRDYWTSYLLDTTLRYRTILNVDISFLISSLVVFTEQEQQPFIEDAIASNGTISVKMTLSLFSRWVYSKMNSLPKFDIAIAVTSLESNDAGGIVGGIGAACNVDHHEKIHYGTAVFVDYRMSYVLIGAHELGHLLGARHDEELVNFPECSAEKFIMNDGMGGNTEQRQYFFSSCSIDSIGSFLRSNEAECLRRINNPKSKLSDIQAPSRLEQCKRVLPGKDVYVNNDFGVCSKTTCFWNEEGMLENKTISLVDRTPCTNGKECFRNNCIRSGQALQNHKEKTCIRAENQFSSSDKLFVISCSNSQDILTPLEKFALTSAREGGYIISTPYSNPDFSKSGEKCLYATENDEFVLLNQCKEDDEPWMIWDLIFNSQGKSFLLKHRITARCAKLDRGIVTMESSCNSENASLMWNVLFNN